MKNTIDIIEYWISGKYRLSEQTIAWIHANLMPIDDLRDTYLAMTYDIDNANTYQLDVIGRLVGVERLNIPKKQVFWGWLNQSDYARSWGAPWYGYNDELDPPEPLSNELFKRVIKCKIIKNVSDGTYESSLYAANHLTNTQCELMRDFSDFSMWFEHGGDLDEDTQTIINLYDLAVYPTTALFKGFSKRPPKPKSIRIIPDRQWFYNSESGRFIAEMVYTDDSVITSMMRPDLFEWSASSNITINDEGYFTINDTGQSNVTVKGGELGVELENIYLFEALVLRIFAPGFSGVFYGFERGTFGDIGYLSDQSPYYVTGRIAQIRTEVRENDTIFVYNEQLFGDVGTPTAVGNIIIHELFTIPVILEFQRDLDVYRNSFFGCIISSNDDPKVLEIHDYFVNNQGLQKPFKVETVEVKHGKTKYWR